MEYPTETYDTFQNIIQVHRAIGSPMNPLYGGLVSTN